MSIDIRTIFNYDILIIGQQPWDTEIGSNCKNIALEFSKSNRVLYVNSPLDRITLHRQRSDPKTKKRLSIIKGSGVGLIQIKSNLWNLYPDCMVESINWIKFTNLFNIINYFNNRKLAKSIQKSIQQLGFTNFVLFNDNEIFKGFYLSDLLKPKISIYYSRDYMIGVDYWKKHGKKLEPLLIAKNDLCFANSVYLSDYCKQYNKNSFNVGQGCEVQEFKNPPQVEFPFDLKKLKGKKIGYVGSLDINRLDVKVLRDIAENFPNDTVILVGPEDSAFRKSDLHQLSNILFLGQKPLSELPAYVDLFDICINPQLVNAITIGNYPRKIDEYLSAGKPVVATATRAMTIFEDYVYLALESADYTKLIIKAMNEDSNILAPSRVEFASGHTWENCVNEMKCHIQDFVKNKDHGHS